MFCLRKPSDLAIQQFLNTQKTERFSYSERKMTQRTAPARYTADHHRIKLGKGIATWDCARRALDQWKMFNTGWTYLCWPDETIAVDATVAIVASHYGFWSVNACRILEVIDVGGNSPRYGFAYGTLRDHAAIGEERFTVEYHRDETVWYDIYALSRPGAVARLAYPLARHLQKRFAKDSQAAMLRAVQLCAQSAS